jgi:hypothetical protein
MPVTFCRHSERNRIKRELLKRKKRRQDKETGSVSAGSGKKIYAGKKVP